jgi:hypothetical protein
MNADEQLLYEARVRTRYSVLAGAAAVLLVAAIAVQIGGAHSNVDEQTIGLITANKRLARDIIGSIFQAFGYFALAATLDFLFRATRARLPDVRPAITGAIAVAGCVLAGISVCAYVVVYGIKAHQFVNRGTQTYEQANHLLSTASLVIPQLLNYLGGLLVAVGFVLVSMNAMRSGLLTRFMGYLGMFAGALVIIPLVPIPVVEAYWLAALAYLLSGRWPTGVPPAWRSGRAEKWPSSQELREQRMKAGGGRAKPSAAPAPEPVGATAPTRTRSTTPKRKRKRRR